MGDHSPRDGARYSGVPPASLLDGWNLSCFRCRFGVSKDPVDVAAAVAAAAGIDYVEEMYQIAAAVAGVIVAGTAVHSFPAAGETLGAHQGSLQSHYGPEFEFE